MQQPPQPQQQQPKPASRSRIDPNQVPNPISVEEDNQELYNQQPFLTSSRSMPPLVSTEVKVIDDGKNYRLVNSLNIVKHYLK